MVVGANEQRCYLDTLLTAHFLLIANLDTVQKQQIYMASNLELCAESWCYRTVLVQEGGQGENNQKRDDVTLLSAFAL
jgi:hypothetical protein